MENASPCPIRCVRLLWLGGVALERETSSSRTMRRAPQVPVVQRVRPISFSHGLWNCRQPQSNDAVFASPAITNWTESDLSLSLWEENLSVCHSIMGWRCQLRVSLCCGLQKLPWDLYMAWGKFMSSLVTWLNNDEMRYPFWTLLGVFYYSTVFNLFTLTMWYNRYQTT